jgi:HD-like signal output (HDOD) protein
MIVGGGMDVSDARKRRSAILKTINLPAASAASNQLLELVRDDDVDLASLAQAIQSEPGITARIISIANSSFFAPPNPVHTVEEAMVKVLGLKTVKSLVMGILLGPRFNTKPCPAFSLQQYWCRAQAVAQSSALMVKNIVGVDASKVYLAGLLHSIGQMLQVHHFPKEMNSLLPKLAGLSGQERISMERKMLGLDASDAGAWVAKRWDLPEETITTLKHFVDPHYSGEHWQIVRSVGFVVRFYQYQENTKLSEKDIEEQKHEELEVAKIFAIEPATLEQLKSSFSEIEQAVSVLAEFLIEK